MMPSRLVAERARLLVHQGGVTLTAAALALGIPQVILARFHENGLAGQFVSDARLGYTNRLDAEGDWIRETVTHARNDNELRNRARRRIPEFRSWFSKDPTGIVATKAARLLGLSATVAPQLHDPHQWSPI